MRSRYTRTAVCHHNLVLPWNSLSFEELCDAPLLLFLPGNPFPQVLAAEVLHVLSHTCWSLQSALLVLGHQLVQSRIAALP